VLIVDDESDVRYFMQIILQTHGYGVVAARNAEEALQILQARGDEIHLVFSDLGLSKMDGFGLALHVRKSYPRIKIILSSGYIDSAIKARMAEVKVDGFMSKPYETPVMLEMVRSILDGK
jgi:CheY-like chemotaxis protein